MILFDSNPMPNLRKRLYQAGLSPLFLRSILPVWWREEMAFHPAEYATLLDYLNLQIGIPLDVLQNRFAPIPIPNIPIRHPATELHHRRISVEWTTQFALSVARIALRALPQAHQENIVPLVSADDIRSHILQSHSTITLSALVEYCRQNNILVLHIPKIKKANKPRGIAAWIDGRVAIILLYRYAYPSLVAFDLAHELGHFMTGHLQQGDVIVDGTLEIHHGRDLYEEQANTFARQIFMGSVDEINAHERLSGKKLARLAQQFADAHHVQPGAIALAYAHHKNFMPVGLAALDILEPNGDASRIINETLLRHISPDELSYEAQDILLRALGSKESIRVLDSAEDVGDDETKDD